MDLRGRTLTELRGIYRQVTGRETTMRDKKKIESRLQSLAESADVAVAARELLGGESVSVTVQPGSTESRIREAIASLPADEARSVLSAVGEDYLAESDLRARKKEACRAIRADIADAEEQLRAIATGEDKSDDPAADLARIDRHWRDAEELRGNLKRTTNDFNDQIDTIRERIRKRLDELRQPSLPGVD